MWEGQIKKPLKCVLSESGSGAGGGEKAFCSHTALCQALGTAVNDTAAEKLLSPDWGGPELVQPWTPPAHAHVAVAVQQGGWPGPGSGGFGCVLSIGWREKLAGFGAHRVVSLPCGGD